MNFQGTEFPGRAHPEGTRGTDYLKMPSHLQTFLRGLLVTAFYAVALWRIVKTNRGNRVIECDVISLVSAFAFGFAATSGAPDWVLESLGTLLLLMCFLTVGLFAHECSVAFRRKLWKSDCPTP
jgi:hypothetical protein